MYSPIKAYDYNPFTVAEATLPCMAAARRWVLAAGVEGEPLSDGDGGEEACASTLTATRGAVRFHVCGDAYLTSGAVVERCVRAAAGVVTLPAFPVAGIGARYASLWCGGHCRHLAAHCDNRFHSRR
jgi:hypothetical protein